MKEIHNRKLSGHAIFYNDLTHASMSLKISSTPLISCRESQGEQRDTQNQYKLRDRIMLLLGIHVRVASVCPAPKVDRPCIRSRCLFRFYCSTLSKHSLACSNSYETA